jgi:hypothetical protein
LCSAVGIKRHPCRLLLSVRSSVWRATIVPINRYNGLQVYAKLTQDSVQIKYLHGVLVMNTTSHAAIGRPLYIAQLPTTSAQTGGPVSGYRMPPTLGLRVSTVQITDLQVKVSHEAYCEQAHCERVFVAAVLIFQDHIARMENWSDNLKMLTGRNCP